MSERTYPVRFTVVSKFFGQLCNVLAFLNMVPFGTSIMFGEPHIAIRYAIVICIYLAIGTSLARRTAPRDMQTNEGMVISVLTFMFTCLLTTYPVMGKGLNFIDAFFEVVSCITSTGLSTVTSVVNAPRSFLFERAWMAWYGGLGFITLAIAIVMHSSLATRVLGGIELDTEDVLGESKMHVQRVVQAYCVLTLIGFIGCWWLGLKFFDAVLYSLSAISTSGDTPTDSGLSGLGLPLQLWVSLICIFGAIPLTIYYRYLHKNRYFTADILQVKTFILICIIISLAVATCMHFISGIAWKQTIHDAPMLIVQTQTSAGFTGIDCTKLDPGSKLLAIFSMFLGGGTGSTAGGIKLLRLLIVMTMLKVAIQRMGMSRNAVLKPKLAGMQMHPKHTVAPLLLIILFLAVAVFSWLAFLINGYKPLDSLFVLISAICTTGFDMGIVNASLSTFLKLVLCFDMLFGRLEVFAWLVMLNPWTWFGTSKMEKV